MYVQMMKYFFFLSQILFSIKFSELCLSIYFKRKEIQIVIIILFSPFTHVEHIKAKIKPEFYT